MNMRIRIVVVIYGVYGGFVSPIYINHTEIGSLICVGLYIRRRRARSILRDCSDAISPESFCTVVLRSSSGYTEIRAKGSSLLLSIRGCAAFR